MILYIFICIWLVGKVSVVVCNDINFTETQWKHSLVRKSLNTSIVAAKFVSESTLECSVTCSHLPEVEEAPSFYYEPERKQCHCNLAHDDSHEDPDLPEMIYGVMTAFARVVKDKLEVDITVADIDIAHRTGIFQNDGNRPIICKFVSRFTKHDVIKARRKLKKSGYVIKEDLTIQNAKLLEKTKALETVESAWSHEGKIIALLKTGTSMVVNWKTDLDELGRIE